MQTFRDLICRWPTLKLFAEEVGVPETTASAWKMRNNIRPDHWAKVIDAAERQGFEDITLELLASLATKKRRAGAGDESTRAA